MNTDDSSREELVQKQRETHDENSIKEVTETEKSDAKKLTVPPMRKISRFLVSPVIEQKAVVSEGEMTIRHEVVEQPFVTIKQDASGTSETINNQGNAPIVTFPPEDVDTGVFTFL